MVDILVRDIIPILVIMILGYVCGKFTYFTNEQRQGFNKLVLNIALPAALFVSIVKATREMLADDITLTILSLVGVVAMFMLSFFLCRLFFKRSIQEAAVCALIAGSPTIGFLGFAVLDPIYGNNVDTNLVIAIVAIVVNAVTIPIGFYLINVGLNRDKSLAKAKATSTGNGSSVAASGTPTGVVASPGNASSVNNSANTSATSTGTATNVSAHNIKGSDGEPDKKLLRAERRLEKAEAHMAQVEAKEEAKAEELAAREADPEHKKAMNPNVKAIVDALKQPVVWSPLLAVLLVIIGVRVPDAFDPTFELIAKANSGVAVLAAGMALATVKFSVSKETLWNTFYRLILTPAVFVVVGLLLGMAGDGDKLSMLVLAVALPPAFSGIIISARYNIYVREGASSVALSTVGFAATAILWIWLMPIITKMFA